MIYEYSGRVTSDLKSIKIFLEKILSDIKNYIEDENIIFDIRLILNELVINSATHGNKLCVNKYINLEILIKGEKVRILVEDEGSGIEHDITSYDPKELKCCGRGLLIVNSLSDQCLVEKNKVIVTKTII